MNEFFDYISRQSETSDDILGLQYGIVATNDDPLKIGRIQVYDQAKGGQYKSDWLFRALPFTSFTPPVPTKDDLVVFGYINGDPHQGCYVGVIVNNGNPTVGSSKDFTIVLGGAKVVITSEGKVDVTGATEVNVSATKVNITATQELKLQAATLTLAASSVMTFTSPTTSLSAAGKLSLLNKEVAVVGGVDSRGDSIVTSGQ